MSLNGNLERIKKLQNFIRNDAPRIVGIEAIKHFKKSFRDEGFTDEVFRPWVPAKRKSKGNGKYANRPTLTQSGALGDAFSYDVDLNTVYIKNDRPYAEIHNEGGFILASQSVKAHKRWVRTSRGGREVEVRPHVRQQRTHMPKRQFMGRSATLTKTIITQLDKRIHKILS